MSFSVSSFDTDQVLSNAIGIAQDACQDIDAVLSDIENNGTLGGPNSANFSVDVSNNTTRTTTSVDGADVLTKYGATSYPTTGLNISEASGAMVIDDLMQKISTKVQVASQLLSTANNIAKTASRILSQG